MSSIMMDDSGIDSDTTKRHKTTTEDNDRNSDEDSNTSDCSMRVTKPSFFQKKMEQYAKPGLMEYNQMAVPNSKSSKIDKLPVLVDWDSSDSEMEIRFFPGPKARQTLSDTFSLQEFHGSIESEDLDLIPPQHATKTDNQCCSLVLQRCTIL
ncbi:uncharacterized protein LOC113554166 [Rhopalosiphum maidis]|uniref:uncharacterized protein LOC113554166 n=1 Tax=Rhopalosiphum maidis TaxID=43146 RepID=UPI000EFDCA20|nr:uncharacterized protein LOC113554166 [Rhopalosiphum maidis]